MTSNHIMWWCVHPDVCVRENMVFAKQEQKEISVRSWCWWLNKTRKYFSRMPTIHLPIIRDSRWMSLNMSGLGVRGIPVQWGSCCTSFNMLGSQGPAHEPPVIRITDKHDWKHYLPATLSAGGNKRKCAAVLSVNSLLPSGFPLFQTDKIPWLFQVFQ